MRRSARNVALLMDGNARWAEHHGLPIPEGHQAGRRTLKARVGDAIELGIDQLTIFDTELRPGMEVAEEVPALGEELAAGTPELLELGIRVHFVGRRDGVSAELAERLIWTEATTATNNRLTLFCGLNYGGRAEVVSAAQAFESGGEDGFRAQLYAPEMRDPDLLIRTNGERRLSGYLLWQCAYSELIFRDEPWPDFDRKALEECLQEFEARQRRFGARR